MGEPGWELEQSAPATMPGFHSQLSEIPSVCVMHLEIKARKEPPRAYHQASHQLKYGATCAVFWCLCSTPTTANQPVLLPGGTL